MTVSSTTLKTWRQYNGLAYSDVAIMFGAYASSGVALTATDIISFENGSRTIPSTLAPANNLAFTNVPVDTRS